MLINFFLLLCLYQDIELTTLWNTIKDLNNPTYEEFLDVENYLKQGKRPYLDPLRIPHQNSDRLPSILNLKLVGKNGEMPVFERHQINIRRDTEKRCILLFGSYNGGYPTKVRRALYDLETCGYSGNVLLRIGGFPNLPNGGIKLCHVPYAFKVAFLKEAALLGFREILWLDTSFHPFDNLDAIFAAMEERGYFFTWVGSLQDNAPSNRSEAAEELGISGSLFPYIHHIASGIMGINMEMQASRDFLDEWYQETGRVYPNITWFPEELSLSVTAWRYTLEPFFWFGHIVCNENALHLRDVYPDLHFYIDTTR